MSEYQESTQFTSWTISIEDQTRYRENQYLLYDNASPEEKQRIFSAANKGIHADYNVADTMVKSSVEDEEIVINDFCSIIRQFCGASSMCKVKTSWRVPNTAVVYFRRFYVFNSLREHDPRRLMFACIFLAGKVEESNVSPKDLTANFSLEVLIEEEQKLITGLDFDLRVFQPEISIRALLSDMRRDFSCLCTLPEVDVGIIIREWLSRSEEAACILMNSPVALSHNPTTIAVAVILRTQTLQEPIFTQYLTLKFGDEGAQALLDISATLFPLIDQQKPDPAVVRAAKKKLMKNSKWGKVK